MIPDDRAVGMSQKTLVEAGEGESMMWVATEIETGEALDPRKDQRVRL